MDSVAVVAGIAAQLYAARAAHMKASYSKLELERLALEAWALYYAVYRTTGTAAEQYASLTY